MTATICDTPAQSLQRRPTHLPARLRVVHLDDDPAAAHSVTSQYVEWFWLPVLGPTCVWMLRRLGPPVAARPAGIDVDLVELAAELGLARRSGPNSPVVRGAIRLTLFGAARWDGAVLAVRSRLPDLTYRQIARLSPALQAQHQAQQARGQGRS